MYTYIGLTVNYVDYNLYPPKIESIVYVNPAHVCNNFQKCLGPVWYYWPIVV